MTKNVLISGNDWLVEAILQHNIIQDQELNLIWYQKETEFPRLVHELLAAATLAKNLNLTATNTPDWASIDLILVGNQAGEKTELSSDERLHAEIHWTQIIVNQAMANNFAGKICFLTRFSEPQVFAALHFSGLPENAIFGIGTLPLALVAEQLLANTLKIDVRQIHVSVLGTLLDPIPAWSRGLVAGTPLLSLVAQENSIFSQDKLLEIEKILKESTPKSLLPAILASIDKIFTALFSQFAQILPLTHQVLLGKQKIAVSEPVLLSNQGVSKLPSFTLSEQEKQDLARIKVAVLTQIENLTGGN